MHDQLAPFGRDLPRGLNSIHQQVQKDLLELDPIAPDQRQVWRQGHFQSHAVLLEFRTHERKHVTDDASQVTRPVGDRRSRQQGANPGDHLPCPFAVLHDGRQRLSDTVQVGSVRFQPVQARAGVRDDSRQRLVDLMGDGGGELAQRRHPRDVRELLSCLVQRFLGPLALRARANRRHPVGQVFRQMTAERRHGIRHGHRQTGIVFDRALIEGVALRGV